VTTLGGFTPTEAYFGLPALDQTWWKPCLHRGEDGDTHAWYLAPTKDGSLFCWECRRGAPRVVIGPADWIGDIRDALERGDMRTVHALLAAGKDGDVEPDPPAPPPAPFRPRDLAEWKEFAAERAAIFEHLGGFDKATAEKMARELAGPPPVTKSGKT